MTMPKGAARVRGECFLGLIIDHCRTCLIDGGIEPGRADFIATEVSNRCAADWGGQYIYVPKDFASILSKRDREIYDKFKGNNHSELAKEYNISVVWVYKIIRTVREYDRKHNQPDLFSQE